MSYIINTAKAAIIDNEGIAHPIDVFSGDIQQIKEDMQVHLSTVSIHEHSLPRPLRKAIVFQNCDGIGLYNQLEGNDQQQGIEAVTLTYQDLQDLLLMLQDYRTVRPFTLQEKNKIYELIYSTNAEQLPAGPEDPNPSPGEEPAGEEPAGGQSTGQPTGQPAGEQPAGEQPAEEVETEPYNP